MAGLLEDIRRITCQRTANDAAFIVYAENALQCIMSCFAETSEL